jgi:hypothetical protein
VVENSFKFSTSLKITSRSTHGLLSRSDILSTGLNLTLSGERGHNFLGDGSVVDDLTMKQIELVGQFNNFAYEYPTPTFEEGVV